MSVSIVLVCLRVLQCGEGSAGVLVVSPVSVACEVKVPLGVMLQLYCSPVFPTEASLMTGVRRTSGCGHGKVCRRRRVDSYC